MFSTQAAACNSWGAFINSLCSCPTPDQLNQSRWVELGHWDTFQSSSDNSHVQLRWDPLTLPLPHLSTFSSFVMLCSASSPSLKQARLLSAPGFPFPLPFPLQRLNSPQISTSHSVLSSNATTSPSSSLSTEWGFHLFSLHSLCPIILAPSWPSSPSNLTCVVIISSLLKCKLHKRRDFDVPYHCIFNIEYGRQSNIIF